MVARKRGESKNEAGPLTGGAMHGSSEKGQQATPGRLAMVPTGLTGC